MSKKPTLSGGIPEEVQQLLDLAAKGAYIKAQTEVLQMINKARATPSTDGTEDKILQQFFYELFKWAAKSNE